MVTQLKIAFCFIAKDKANILDRLLNSTKGVFDLYCLADTGSTDNTIEVFDNWLKQNRKKGVVNKGSLVDNPKELNEYHYTTVNNQKILADFGKARQVSFELAKGMDFAFWADTDDIIVGAENIRLLAEKMDKGGFNLGLINYAYAKVAKNAPNPVMQKREKLIDLRVEGHWSGRVHENYNVKEAKAVPINDVRVEHERTAFEAMETERRNHQIMEQELKEVGIEKIDDKTLHDMAYDHWEWKEFDKAIEYYQVLLSRNTTNPEMTFNILIKLVYAFSGQNNLEQALIYANRAIHFAPQHPDGYVALAELYANMNQFEEANFYADKILKLGRPQTVAPINEMNYTVLPYKIKAEFAVRENKVDEAIGYLKEIYKIMPNDDLRLDIAKLEKEKVTKNAVDGIYRILQYCQNNNIFDSIQGLISAIPKDLRENPTVRALIKEGKTDYRRKTNNVKLEGSKSIIFYAGPFFEQWDGNSDTKLGIGGSESMCILMARELAKLGNKVFVYNETGEDHEVDGVTYINHQKWNASTKSDIFISLRHPEVFSQIILSKKQYLWFHDTYYGELPLINLYSPNKIIVLSEAHKNVIQKMYGLNNDIFWMSRNAINQRAFPKIMPKRDPYRIIWASSYDRGLDNFLSIWPRIKAEVPQANARLFYGWNTYDAMMNQRQSQEMMNYKQQILRQISESDGVTELGRISQADLYNEFAQSSIWFYPTEFYEISCINAMTAQAMGCIPVCTPMAALNETVNSKFGFKSDLSRIQDTVIYLLKHQEELSSRRIPMMDWAKNKFNAKKLAKEWDNEFNG